MPRFVLLYHDWPPSEVAAATPGAPSHWDLMLESAGALMTWRLTKLPAIWHETDLTATRLPDHRLDYLDYEGPVSGDRGHVSRVDAGSYELLEQSAECLHVRLAGALAIGEVRLPTAPSSPKSPPSS